MPGGFTSGTSASHLGRQPAPSSPSLLPDVTSAAGFQVSVLMVDLLALSSVNMANQGSGVQSCHGLYLGHGITPDP